MSDSLVSESTFMNQIGLCRKVVFSRSAKVLIEGKEQAPAIRDGRIRLQPDDRKGETTGRDDRIRTCDPHTPSVMRYQAALRPDQWRPRL